MEYYVRRKNWEYNLYSSEDSNIDCLRIANHFGGNGEIHAAKFTSNDLLMKRGDNIVFTDLHM